MSDWQPEPKADLTAVIARVERELPGWWWSVGSCSISAHASIGPDLAGSDKHLLEIKEFDDGFHADLSRPSTIAEALTQCIDEAVKARKDLGDTALDGELAPPRISQSTSGI